jgi:hypothetical protein
MARVENEDQLGLDEEVVSNPDVERALIERQNRKDALKSVQRQYKDAHDAAVGLLKMIELPEEGAVRIGRFRVTNRFVAGGHREFDTSDRSQISISFLGEQTKAFDDRADLRPKGEVNADALRGAAERSSEPTPIRRRNGGQPQAPTS